MRYYIIAGESSGDLHGANLLKSIKSKDPQAEFRFWGGDKMAEIAGPPVKHYKNTAFMGIGQVLMNLGKIASNFKLCKKDLLQFKPDVLILIDYPGFNLRMAKFASEHNIKVFYYISPKVWVWKESRVQKIKKYVDRMFCIFPFEVDFYKKHDYEVDYVGNPIMDAIAESQRDNQQIEQFKRVNNLDQRPVIALLAGSRQHEIDELLPVMLKVSKQFSEYQFVIAGAPSISESFYEKYTKGYDVRLVKNKTYELLKHASAAMVTSGTATLETALFKVPEVVCYKIGRFTYTIGRLIVKVRFFSLVNIIMQREVVKELLQNDLEENIEKEMKNILYDKKYRDNMLNDFDILREKIGEPGASDRLATKIIHYLS